MPKLVHTIDLAVEKASRRTVSSTRETTGRRYVACLVATTTEASLRIAEATKIELEEKVEAAKVALAAAIAKWGISVKESEARHEARSKLWYDSPDGWSATGDKFRKAAGDAYVPNLDGLMRKDMASRGFENPFDPESDYAVTLSASNLRVATRTLEWHLEMMAQAPLGSQAVISWHQSMALAEKALGSAECESIRKRGDQIAIRTDIAVRERAVRARKSAV